MSADSELKKKQMSAREQCIEIIGEEFTKKWEALPPDLKMVLAGTDFMKHSSHINTFKVGSSHQKKKKQSPKQAPRQQTQSTNVQSQSENIFTDSQTACQNQSNNNKIQNLCRTKAKSKSLHKKKTVQKLT